MKFSTSDIVVIVAAVIGVLGALSPWIAQEVSAKHKQKIKYKNRLKDLQSFLRDNKQHYENLINIVREIRSKYNVPVGMFEAPDYVKQIFDQSGENKRRWRERISLLIENNQKALAVIEDINSDLLNYSKNQALQEEVGKFRVHAQAFNAIWKEILSQQEIRRGINLHLWYNGENPVEADVRSQQEIEQYPKFLDKLLAEEIEHLGS
jgi:uncharacterized phage-like protein YoqJ